MTDNTTGSYAFGGLTPGGLAAAAQRDKEFFYNDPTVKQMQHILARAEDWSGAPGTFDTVVRFPNYHAKDAEREALIEQIGDLAFDHGVYIQWTYRRLLQRKAANGETVPDEEEAA